MSAEDVGSPTVLRSSAVMAAGTTVSRVLGFVRNIVVAHAIGLNLLAETYNVANALPNIIYILIAGGALNAVFVPQLVRAMKEPDGGERYTNALLTVALTALAVLTVLATVCAPLIIRAYTDSGWSASDVGVATTFAYWCVPQIFFYGLFTLLGQVLNARGRFGPMMWAPILNNLVVIATGVLFIVLASVRFGDTRSISGGEIALLGAGTTLGIVVQALVLLPVVRQAGYRFRPSLRLSGLGLRQAGSLASWTLLFVAVNQVGYLFVTRFATAAGKAAGPAIGAGFSAYSNAYLVFLLPHSIATVSLVTALLPRMSRASADGRLADLRQDLSSGLRTAAVATVPAAVGFLALGRDLVAVMYAGSGANNVGWVLTAFAGGLVVFSAQHLVLRGFYAQEDTRTPFFVQVVIVAVNVALVVLAHAVLAPRWVTVGMAGSYAVAYAVGLALSTSLLSRRLGTLDRARIVRTHVRLIVAAALPGVAAWGLARAITATFGSGVWAELGAVLAGGALLLGGYLLLARRMRVEELTDIVGLVRRRTGG